jgi:DNA topoisomerase-1
MSKHLVIVESPAKAKTIKKYLGSDFNVLASYGHVRDLLPKKGSVDPNNDFAMKYEIIERNSKHLDLIAKTLKQSDSLYLATDPDREGEAISWHVQQDMERRKLLKDRPTYRIFFNEITKTAVKEAVANPRDISMEMVNAQQARRALDYLVGFNLSPLLWKKIRRGLSAGRVQSPALRLIVEREIEIENFVSQEYWKITAQLLKAKYNFEARLTHFEGEKLEQFTIQNEQQANQVKQTLLSKSQNKVTVKKIEKKQRKRHPAAPFITSTLQQEASRKLGFTTRKTMSVAQQLYEGIEIGTGTVGLITYMRTDSVNLAQEAIQDIRGLIERKYGSENLPDSPRVFKTKSKNAQEAHEAIRPTSINQSPDMIKQYLSNDQLKLYSLIWKRTVACQMIHATIDTVAVDFACPESSLFRANGSTIKHPGFMSVYLEGKDDSQEDDSKENLLPEFNEGEVIDLNDVKPSQHFTEPPPRYSEASLVKALEEYDIGRPSTYASIIQTLQQREYVVLEKKRFIPTDVGRVVNRFLTVHFTKYVDYGFTASLEDQLDEIARGEKAWIPVLQEFWTPFIDQIGHIDESVQRKDVTTELIEDKCPKCQSQLAIRLGKRGRFIGCTNYPDCDYTSSMDGNDESQEPEVIQDRKCPSCEHDLVIKTGRYGKFIGCSQYPTCRHMEPLEKPADTNISCPQCNQGNILQRKSRRGKVFYSCARYPDCDYAMWNEPVAEACPDCNWPILSVKETKARGKEKVCPQKNCGYKIQLDSEE